MGKFSEVMFHTNWYTLMMQRNLNHILVYVDSAVAFKQHILVYADSAIGLQYSKDRGNRRNCGDL